MPSPKIYLISSLLISLVGCNPWSHLPYDGSYSIGKTWDDDIVATTDGLYVMLPTAGDLLLIRPDGTFSPVDLRGASPRSLHLAPDNATLLVFATWTWCNTDDPTIDTLSECPTVDQEQGSELHIIQNGVSVRTLEISPQFNRIAFSPIDPTGQVAPVAVAYLEYEGQEINVSGIENLTSVDFINLTDGSVKSFNAGFAANDVLFTQRGDRAVVLSRNEAIVVDLTTDPYEKIVGYQLTTSDKQEVIPSAATITADDRYLIIAVKNMNILYVMDLEREYINTVDLTTVPSAMAEDSYSNITTLVYANQSQADLLDHEFFNTTSIPLDEPCSSIANAGDGSLILYNNVAATHDVYRLDLEVGEEETTWEETTYLMPNPVSSLEVAPGDAFAVAVLKPENTSWSDDLSSAQDSYWGLDILDLSDDDHIPLWLESAPVGLAFNENTALVLLEGDDSLYQVDLMTGDSTEIDIPAPPTGIGSLPEGGFYITHDSAIGLISFLNPQTGDITEVSGFAIQDLLDEGDTLPRQDDVLSTTEE